MRPGQWARSLRVPFRTVLLSVGFRKEYRTVRCTLMKSVAPAETLTLPVSTLTSTAGAGSRMVVSVVRVF